MKFHQVAVSVVHATAFVPIRLQLPQTREKKYSKEAGEERRKKKKIEHKVHANIGVRPTNFGTKQATKQQHENMRISRYGN